MKFVSTLFFTDIDFCTPKVIKGLVLNLNLYLLIILRGAYRYLTIHQSYLNTFWLYCQHSVHQFSISQHPPSQQKNSLE